MSEITHEDILDLKEKFEANYDDESVFHTIQGKCTRIVEFMGLENAKKLSQDQLQNMIMVTR